METYNTHCEFNSPRTWENLPPTSKNDFWQYSKIYCQSDDVKLLENELIQNSTTGAESFIKKSISYGDFLIIIFLMIFLIFGILKFLTNFLIPKLMNFKR